MTFSINITKRERKRKHKSGEEVTHTRYVLNYREPRTDKRKQHFFERQKDAIEARNKILASVQNGSYCDEKKVPTIREAFEHWLNSRKGEVKTRTLEGYECFRMYICGPLLMGSREQRTQYNIRKTLPEGTKLREMLGFIKISDLSTAEIRAWHKLLQENVGNRTANKAKSILGTILSMASEDFGVRPPPLPQRIGRGKPKEKKAILTPEQVGFFIKAARQDNEKGIYCAFPFLAGTRPSEQLALLWEDVDFDRNVLHIRRMQEPDGSITNFTKTTAGTRQIPMCSLLREMLLEWRIRCPRKDSQLHRVFPAPGIRQKWPKPRMGGGGPLLYSNFRLRYWENRLKKWGLPYVTPHSARHCFISTLQAQGVEVGLVAKLAGHSNAVVTLGHYTQAVRGGEDAVEALAKAFNG